LEKFLRFPAAGAAALHFHDLWVSQGLLVGMPEFKQISTACLIAKTWPDTTEE
jgi:hypothetical protein